MVNRGLQTAAELRTRKDETRKAELDMLNMGERFGEYAGADEKLDFEEFLAMQRTPSTR